MSNAPHESAPPADTHDSDDADRGNLDGTTASNSPREESLDDAKAQAQAQGNGSFDDGAFDDAAGADGADAAQAASDAGGSGQDNGSMS